MRATAKQYATALYELLTEDGADTAAVAKQFIRKMHTDGKLKELPAVLRFVEELDREKRGVTAVTARVAREMDVSEIEKLAKELTGVEQMELETVVDEDILGGMQIETTNQRWDLSARGQLRSLASSIKN